MALNKDSYRMSISAVKVANQALNLFLGAAFFLSSIYLLRNGNPKPLYKLISPLATAGLVATIGLDYLDYTEK